MVASQTGPYGGQIGDPGGGRLPDWMLGDNEMSQTMVLLMRRKQKDIDSETQTPNNSRQRPLSNPFIVGASIDVAVGLDEAKKVIVNKEGRGSRYLLRTRSKIAFDKLRKVSKLTDGTEIEVIVHPTLNIVQGVVYEPDCTEIDEATVLSYLESQGVKSVRRITKRINDTVKNTPLIVLTFHGTQLPEYILFGRLRVSVRAYYPSPLICFNCCDYGHPRKFCRDTGVCLNCSQKHQPANGEKCNNTPHCKHCQGEHSSVSRSCPKYREEENIIRMQIDQKISTAEARKIYFDKNNKETMASEIQRRLTLVETEKDKIIAELRAEVKYLRSKLDSVFDELSKRCQEDSQKEVQQEVRQEVVTPASSSSEQKKKSQRLSRKDKTFISPPATRSSSKKIGNISLNDSAGHTRSRSRKHPIEISPTDTNHNRKRPSCLSNTDENAIDVDE